jgi:hypothetical protein
VEEWYNFILENLRSSSGVALASGVFGAIFYAAIHFAKNKYDYNIQKNGQEKDNFQVILEERKQERDENKKEIRELRGEVNILQAKVSSLEGIVAQRPFPEWSLSFGKFTWCNIAMDHTFLVPLNKTANWLIGKSPAEIWSEEVSNILIKLDEIARSSYNHTAFKSNILIGENYYTVIKYGKLDMISGRILTYYGMAIPQHTEVGDL